MKIIGQVAKGQSQRWKCSFLPIIKSETTKTFWTGSQNKATIVEKTCLSLYMMDLFLFFQ